MPTQSIPWWSRCTSRPPGGKGHGVRHWEKKHGKNPWFIARKIRNPQHYDWADLFCDLWFSFGYNSEDLNKEHGKTWWFQMGSGLMWRFHQDRYSIRARVGATPVFPSPNRACANQHVEARYEACFEGFPYILFYHHMDPSDGTINGLV